MEVILIDKVTNLGNLGDRVHVKAGYGRNFLIPTGRAVPATKKNLEDFEARRVELEKKAAAALAEAEERKTQLEQLSITIAQRAGEEGKLFGSIGTSDITAAVAKAGGKLDKKEVRLPDGPLRVVGEYDIELHLHSDVDARIKVNIVPEI